MARIVSLLLILLSPLVTSQDGKDGGPGQLDKDSGCAEQKIFVDYPHGCFKQTDDMTYFIAADSIKLSKIPIVTYREYSLSLAGAWKSRGRELAQIKLESLFQENVFYTQVYDCCTNSDDCQC